MGYARTTSPQVGTALTNAVLTSDSTRRTDAEFYDYCWDNYELWDVDGDGIVSPNDAIIISKYFASRLLDPESYRIQSSPLLLPTISYL